MYKYFNIDDDVVEMTRQDLVYLIGEKAVSFMETTARKYKNCSWEENNIVYNVAFSGKETK